MSFLSRKSRFRNSKFVLSVDIGTTYTAASYYLASGDSDKQHKFQEINRWPKQIYADAKVPSAIYYDEEGLARLHGAETEDEQSILHAEVNNWQKAEWWKMMLRPDYIPLPEGFATSSLPPLVTVDKAFEDQMAYVLNNVQNFVAKAYPEGEKIWKELYASMVVVLTAPNGWEGRQHNKMRNAAVKAGLVRPDKKNNLRFVSEGEAAIHYCLNNTPKHFIKIGGIALVCDIGGGTTDIGTYKINSLVPINLEEVSISRCFVTGGVFVDYAARNFLENRLAGSNWGSEEDIARIVRTFERDTKRRFTGYETMSFLNLGGSSANDGQRGVERGRLKISKAEMVKFFEPSIKRIRDGLKEVISTSTYPINQIFVVGGFGESPYVYSEVEKLIKGYSIPISKPNDVLSKAIAHGGLSWHLDSGVQVRMARLHYGAETATLFRAGDKDMAGRKKHQDISGESRVRHAWKSIVPKNTRLRLEDEHKEFFHLDFEENADLEVELDLYAYRLQEPPTFFRDKKGNLVEGYIHLGTVKGDLRRCYTAASFRVSKSGKRYKTLQYEVCLYFGDTEIQARLRWKENNSIVYGEATIAYDL